jgi:hypothetical protein
MAGIENLRSGTHRAETANQQERRRDYYFRAIVQSHLLDTFRESLEEADFSDEQIGDLASSLAGLSEEQARTVLALPYEIRQRLFAGYREKIAAGALTPAGMIDDLRAKNERYGYTLGYHLSSHQIAKEKRPDGAVEWNVKGSELDDRDDMKMAYYSEDYLNRYKKKNGKYLYVVRAEMGEHSAHKRDLNNHWGRAPFLSIIDEFDMDAIEQEIEDSAKKEGAAA